MMNKMIIKLGEWPTISSKSMFSEPKLILSLILMSNMNLRSSSKCFWSRCWSMLRSSKRI